MLLDDKSGGRMLAPANPLTIAGQVNEKDLVASVDGKSDASAALVLRYHDPANYLAAVYSSTAKAVYL